jgi:hypothetical protein
VHLAFIEFHNRVVDGLRDGEITDVFGNRFPPPPQSDPNPPPNASIADLLSVRTYWDDLFAAAQQIVRWHYQWIIVHEYLPLVRGQDSVDRIDRDGLRFFDPGGHPFIPVESAGLGRRDHRQRGAGGAARRRPDLVPLHVPDLDADAGRQRGPVRHGRAAPLRRRGPGLRDWRRWTCCSCGRTIRPATRRWCAASTTTALEIVNTLDTDGDGGAHDGLTFDRRRAVDRAGPGRELNGRRGGEDDHGTPRLPAATVERLS